MPASKNKLKTEILLRRAAMAGPGYRGQRSDPSPDERQQLFDSMTELGLEIPDYLVSQTEWVDRDAKLFEAGEYPDKKLNVTKADLERLAATFDMPVPILIEHADNPLQLGYLTQVRASGEELLGTITLSREADALIRKSGADKLSISLDPELAQIREVSLVMHPRVADARMFHIDWPQPAAVDHLTQIQQWIQKGKLIPAQAEIVQSLLNVRATLQFGEKQMSVTDLVSQLIEAQPAHKLFGEVATQPQAEIGPLPNEEAAFYARYFPALDAEVIRKHRRNH